MRISTPTGGQKRVSHLPEAPTSSFSSSSGAVGSGLTSSWACSSWPPSLQRQSASGPARGTASGAQAARRSAARLRQGRREEWLVPSGTAGTIPSRVPAPSRFSGGFSGGRAWTRSRPCRPAAAGQKRARCSAGPPLRCAAVCRSRARAWPPSWRPPGARGSTEPRGSQCCLLGSLSLPGPVHVQGCRS